MNTPLQNQAAELKERRRALRKRIPSKLDALAEALAQMEAEKKTLDEMLAWLKEREVATSRNNLCNFLQRRREEAGWKELREQVLAEKNRPNELEEWFAKNPNPDPGMIMEIFKMQVLELAANERSNTKIIKLADRLTRTAMDYVNDQSREDYRARKLALEEAKQAVRMNKEPVRRRELPRHAANKCQTLIDIHRAFCAKSNQLPTENGGEGRP